MASKVLLKKSSVAGKVPLTGDLSYGELALNYNDGTAYYKTAGDVIEPLVSQKQIFKVITATYTSTDQQVTDSWSASAYRSAKYIIQVTQGTEYQTSEMLLLHNGTNTFTTEYALLHTTPSLLCTVTTDVSGGNVRLLITMLSNSMATINIRRILLES